MTSTAPVSIVFRPKPELLRSGVVGTIVITAALFGSLYLVAVNTPWWPVVLVIHIGSLLVVAFWTARYFTTSVKFTGDRITLRSFPFLTRNFAIGSVDRLIMAEVYIGNTDDTHTHLAVLAPGGTQIFRLRTRFWALNDLHRVAQLIGAPLTTLPEPVTPSEFRAHFIQRVTQE